jgi:hypothetical protein
MGGLIMKAYIVHIVTADHGDFKITTKADSLHDAECIARKCVRYQFTNDIVSSHAVPK